MDGHPRPCGDSGSSRLRGTRVKNLYARERDVVELLRRAGKLLRISYKTLLKRMRDLGLG